PSSRSATTVTSHATPQSDKTRSPERTELCGPAGKRWVGKSKTKSPGGATQELATQRKPTCIEEPTCSVVKASAAERRNKVCRDAFCRKTIRKNVANKHEAGSALEFRKARRRQHNNLILRGPPPVQRLRSPSATAITH